MKITKRQLRRIIREVMTRDEEDRIDYDSLTPAQFDEYDAGYDDAVDEMPPDSRSDVYMAGYEDGQHDRPATVDYRLKQGRQGS